MKYYSSILSRRRLGLCFAAALLLPTLGLILQLNDHLLATPTHPLKERTSVDGVPGLHVQKQQVTSVHRTSMLPASSPNCKTYVVALQYEGQQGSGARSLSAFQCMLGSIYKHFHIVEPFVEGTHIHTYVEREYDSDRLNFSTLFDVNHFNTESRIIGYPEMVDFDQFSNSSPDYVIYVYITYTESKDRVVWASNSSQDCLTSDRLQQPYRTMLEDKSGKALKFVKPKSCIVRFVELHIVNWKEDALNASSMQASEVFSFVFGNWKPDEVTLIFNKWYNKLFVPVLGPLHGIDCLHLYLKDETKIQFRPSRRLLADAERYEDTYLGGRNRLAFMLRVERVLKFYLREFDRTNASIGRPRTLEGCFREVLKLRDEIVGEISSKGVFVALDVGKFGTDSFYQIIPAISSLSEKTLKNLYHNRWTVKQWENSFVDGVNGTSNKGYIAALQRTIASRADCLVLMGGGSFQALAALDYVRLHGNSRCIHLVCTMTMSNTEVQKTIENNA